MPRGMIEILCTVSGRARAARPARGRPRGGRSVRARQRLRTRLLLLQPGDDALHGLVELGAPDRVLAAPDGQQRGLVDEVGQVGAARGPPSSPARLSSSTPGPPASRRARGPAGSPGGPRGRADRPARGDRSGPARSSAGSRISGRLVAAMRMTPTRESKPSSSTRSWFSVCSRSSCATGPTPRTLPRASSSSMKMMQGALLAGLLEQVAHARGAHAHEHLDELRAADAEEGHLRLARDRPRQQRLARARRAHQEDALGHLAAQAAELLGRLVRNSMTSRELLLGLVHAGDVGEARLDLAARGRAWPCSRRWPACRPGPWSRPCGVTRTTTARPAARSAPASPAASARASPAPPRDLDGALAEVARQILVGHAHRVEALAWAPAFSGLVAALDLVRPDRDLLHAPLGDRDLEGAVGDHRGRASGHEVTHGVRDREPQGEPPDPAATLAHLRLRIACAAGPPPRTFCLPCRGSMPA